MKKHGHYCKVCGEYKANETFSGKGHATHICKKCSALSLEKMSEQITINRLLNLPWWLSNADLMWLKRRAKDKRPNVKIIAQENLSIRFPSQYCANQENKAEWLGVLEQEELEFRLKELSERTKQKTISWSVIEYLPISLHAVVGEDGLFYAILSQVFTVKTEVNGCNVYLELSEDINFLNEKGDLYATITIITNGEKHLYDTYYESYATDQLWDAYKELPLVCLAEALTTQVNDSPAAEHGFSYAHFLMRLGS